MSVTAEMTARQALLLQELEELLMDSARDLAARQIEAETGEEAARLAKALAQVARSVRQCALLEARLMRDEVKAQGETIVDVAAKDSLRMAKRTLELQVRLHRVIRQEAPDRLRAERLQGELIDIISRRAFAEDFANEPIEAQVAEIRQALGLPEGDAGLPPTGQPPTGQPLTDWFERRSSG